MDLSPSKIVCVGRNYAAHAKELGNEVPKAPLIFLKPPSSIIRDGGSIRLPTVSKQVEYEGEIGVIVSTLNYDGQPATGSSACHRCHRGGK